MKNVGLVIFVFLLSCSGDGELRDVTGTLKTTSTSNKISSSPYPSITLQGRAAEEFPVQFTGNNGLVANFTIQDIPTKQPAIFQVQGANLDPIISFPFDLTVSSAVLLPALEVGTTQAIIDQIEILLGTSVTSTAGFILGQLKSDGTTVQSCLPKTSVHLRSKETGASVTGIAGPYYFNTQGKVVKASSFQDSQCSYVMANVLPGNYILEFLDSGLQKISSIEVVVIGGDVTFGMDVPQ